MSTMYGSSTASKIFRMLNDQPPEYEAISYAVMDRHDYLDQSCDVVGDSIELFFDATDSMLIAFIDALKCRV
jgi:hypothetical protein